MDWLQDFLDAPLRAAAAVVAGDATLSLLAANAAFYALAGEGDAPLLERLDETSETRLAAEFASSPPNLEIPVAFRHRKEGRVLLSAVRVDGAEHGGAPLYLLAFDDVSRLEELCRHIEFARREFTVLSDIFDDIPFEYDYGEDLITYAPKYREVFGLDPSVPRFLERLRGAEAVDPVSEGLCDAFLAGDDDAAAAGRAECLLPTASGQRRWFALLRATLRDAEGRPIKSVGALRDIDAQKRERLLLLDKSRSDPMTGLFNKATAEEEIRIALRDARPSAFGVLFMIDVDNFKNVNDNLGHLAGDSILREIARRIAGAFRKGDIIGRVGGDEFHVYMRDVADTAIVRTRAERLCETIRNLFASSDVDKAVSVSIGIAVADTPVPYEDLFRQADIALYQAKGSGKNRYRFFGQRDGEDADASHAYAPNAARSTVMVDLIDVLFRMCDTPGGIGEALDFIGKTLRVDKITIFERSIDGATISITHEWCADPAWSERDRFQNVPVAELPLPEPSGPGGIYYCSDLAALPPEQKTFLRDPSITSLLQSDILREGRAVGHVSFEERGHSRLWTQQETDALILMSRIIGECIRQRRASALLRENAGATRAILDSLTRTAVYVIDHARRLLYFNGTVSRLLPHVRVGMTCHEVFWGHRDACSFCPLHNAGESDAFSVILPHTPFAAPSDVSVSRILWESREPAWVVLISEHILTREEETEKKKREILAHALGESYSRVLDLNLESGFYETLAVRQSAAVSFPAAGGYENLFASLQERLSPSFRDGFRRRFSLEALRRDHGAGAQRQMDFLLEARDERGPQWRNLATFPWSPGDGSRHVLQCFRDIDEQTRRELAHRQEEENVRVALQSSYANLCRIDLDAGSIACVYSDPNLLRASELVGRFEEDNRRMVETRVHPEDAVAFCRFFDPAQLRRRLSAGEQPSVEYRKRGEDGAWHWLLALVVALPSAPSQALLLVRDITENKAREANYLLAIQSNYSEIFLIDIPKGGITPLYTTVRPAPAPADFGAFADDAARHVDPDFTEAVRAFYDLPSLSERLARGENIELEYRKRHGEGAPYRWTSAAGRPIPGNEGHAMLLLRDVTDLRDEENNFYRVLRSSYTEIYEVALDSDALRLIYREDNALERPPLGRRYSEGIRALVEAVHPDDRETYLRHYDPDAIRRGIAQGLRLSIEYRTLGKDGTYRWVSSLLLLLPGASTRFLILCQDISERKRMEATALRLQRRQSAIFRQSADSIIEIDLTTWRFLRTTNLPWLGVEPRRGDYRAFFEDAFKFIHPEDHETARRAIGPEALLAARREGGRPRSCQYRMIWDKPAVWLENRVFFLEEGETATAFFLIRDVTEAKRLEEERRREEERFNLALRNSYTELYEIDLKTGRPHLVYSNGTTLIPLDRDGAGVEDVAAAFIHPEDRAAFLSVTLPANVHRAFVEGRQEIKAECRRRDAGGGWRWTSGAAIPLSAHGSCETDRALILVRDITESREQEQRQRISEQYDRALRNIYDELYELNVTRNAYRIVYHTDGKYVTPPDSGALSDGVSLVADNMIYPEDRDRFLHFFDLEAVRRHFASGREHLLGEFRKLWQDGRYHWASLTMFPVEQAEGDDEIYLVFIMDIGEKKQAEELAQQNELLERQRLDDERYRTIIVQTDTLVFEWRIEDGSRYISPDIPSRFAGNYDGRDIMHVWRDDGVIHPDDLPNLQRFLSEARSRRHTEMTARFKKVDGDYVWCKVALTCLRGPDGKAKRYIGTLNDVDSATRSILALKYRAEYDLLTDIYNMHTFYAQTELALRTHPDRRYSIVRMDIDRFKVINDLYGLKEGDRLLISIAALLREKLHGHGVYGRLGGDVFCLCVDYPRERLLALIGEITDRLAAYPLPYKVVPSFGICEVDNIETPINVLCDWANLAMKTIKGNYLNTYAFYDGKLRERILEEKKIENQMHDALLQGQFTLYLQPKVHIPTSRIIGSEGLVRWIHPVEGIMPPDRFIPLFEKNGFIIRLDEYIWEQACITLRRWIDHGLTPTPISVNMSRMHIHDPRLREKLVDLVKRYGLPPHLLELELTESAFLENESGLFESMKDLQRYGFQFSMDDFGSGYSSLNMLKSMPVDFIKIDRGFLNEVVATDRGKTVIRFSISLAKEMNIRVIAEGVENEEQAAFLLEAGCSYAQGYFYSRPLPVQAFEDLAFGSTQPPFPIAPRIREIAEKKLLGE